MRVTCRKQCLLVCDASSVPGMVSAEACSAMEDVVSKHLKKKKKIKQEVPSGGKKSLSDKLDL